MRKFARALFWIAVLLGLVAALLRATFLNVWKIPDDPQLAASVAPSLRPGDLVILLMHGEPGFGDLVRCADPDNAGQFVVGRIAGVAGDHVVATGPTLQVNGRKYDGTSMCPDRGGYTIAHPSSGATIEIACDEVSMGSSWHYRGQSVKPLFTRSAYTADVGSGMVYLLSDDRDFHDDSRDFGPVTRSTCKEQIVFRLWGADGYVNDKRRFEIIR